MANENVVFGYQIQVVDYYALWPDSLVANTIFTRCIILIFYMNKYETLKYFDLFYDSDIYICFVLSELLTRLENKPMMAKNEKKKSPLQWPTVDKTILIRLLHNEDGGKLGKLIGDGLKTNTQKHEMWVTNALVMSNPKGINYKDCLCVPNASH